MHDATLCFEYASVERARIVERSVAQEVGEIDGDRTRATLSRTGPTVTVDLTADDLVALRAGLNTWNSLVGVASQVAGGQG